MSVLGLAKAAVRLEWNIYVSLARWAFRRPAVPAGGTALGYARMVTPVLALWIFGSAAETVAIHFIVPWEIPRLVLDVLGIWGFLWMLGMLASYRVHPHLTSDAGLRVRLGKRADVLVPWDLVASANVVDRDLPSTIRTFQPLDSDDGMDLQIGVSGRANVHVRLREPLAVDVPGGTVHARALTFLADDPRGLAGVVAGRAAARAS